MKIIVDRISDKILGVHMVGIDAPEIIQGIAIAVKMGAKKRDFDSTHFKKKVGSLEIFRSLGNRYSENC